MSEDVFIDMLEDDEEPPDEGLDETTCSAVGGEFYSGLEWFACWLLDHAEGETITEEILRPWAYKAWQAHLKKQNAIAQTPPDSGTKNHG